MNDKLKTLTIVALIVFAFGAGWTLSRAYTNARFKEYHNDIADELLTDCEEDGLEDCKIDWVYDHGQIMSMHSTGRRGE